ncbi:AI-2E family transporter [Pseudoxanthomonas kalamensis DSM 18571]|uniref:AI-2E family transporter n=1 Tax=Pseudoxanthomonas kalamensis TaxID=289483 RepID=UPI00139085AB|nr:AI-2E family transporter [Pseudoxanthomonas kalamensis]KAF1711416.1 AI-2E family transporter [Pseudoxanthomonas kalamensis DSM 18571]
MSETTDANADIARFLKRLQWGLVAFVAGWIVWLLAPILTPFAMAALLGWLGDPLVDRLQRAGRSRTMAVTLVYLLMVVLLALVLVILVPMLERQVSTLINALPGYRDWFVGTALPWLEQRTGYTLAGWFDSDKLIELIRSHWKQAGGIATAVFGYLSSSGFAFLAWIANVVLLPILAFYFLRDWDLLVERVAAMIPRDHIGTASRLASESNEVLGAFLRGQFLVMLALGAIYAIGLSLVGLKLGLLIGIIAGLISFVPYLGTATGIVLGLLAALVQAKGVDIQLLALVGVVFVVGQMLEGYVLTPRIVGDRIGLHPMAVIFAIMAGGQLFGFLGMLLALPVAAVSNVLLRYAHERYTQSRLYAGAQPATALASAGSPEGANIDPLTDAEAGSPNEGEDA